ncbi:TraR/DksA family transcriptional regulator [Novosphingobium malaysiense]|uniref:Zinc finger DksA/TraR C4-type domain-containing protein n=1 Tax=Novosphingobium malaysiense TaxID=1348853 RepID=A0A0B1ZG14_9SPHN|nr:TraR/DksA C4-type zinc finger protein [Novosphingobium malaysiense]KHK89440.1 hypothetical protein LK12_20155 [Novosphingobium malaysiense]
MDIDPEPFRNTLLERRAELEREQAMAAADRTPVELDQESVGRLSRIDAMQVQAMALAQERRRQTELAAIDAALARIEDGEFGYCIKCDEEIAPARLAHMPAVTTCIGCARGD